VTPSQVTSQAMSDRCMPNRPHKGYSCVDMSPNDQTGLSAAEAQARLAQFGPNDPAPKRRGGAARHLLIFFVNPLVVILLAAASVSAVLSDWVNAGIIALMVLVSVVLNFVQTYRSQKAAEALRSRVAPTATVLRDGTWIECPRREIVPGDIIRLSAGDLVPADADVLSARDLHVQEAALTGESLPVAKEAGDRSNPSAGRVFLGTSVVSGNAMAQVTATGPRTVFGDIAARLVRQRPETSFERGLREFSGLIMRTVMLLVLFVFLVNIVFKRDMLESFLFAIALAVGLTPEFLPMITTVTLGRGAMKMAQHKVIVKHLEAIQNFGSIDVLCSDKTGTLTSGEMTLDQHVDCLGQPSERTLLMAYLNSTFETGVRDPRDEAILRKGANPLDVAILRYEHPDVKPYHKLDEIPFDFERRCISVVVESMPDPQHLFESGASRGQGLDKAARPTATGQAESWSEVSVAEQPAQPVRWLITKGAPESVLLLCASADVDGEAQPLDANLATQARATVQHFSAQGLRTLAVAYRLVSEQPSYAVADEHDLCLLGFVTFVDPPLADAAETIAMMKADGVKLKILTGDNDLVAQHVCIQVGLPASETDLVTGDQIESMTDPALAHVAEQSTIFARVSPAQKNRIILALKSRGHVVGYMGDGINDAPSLHTSDVGISVSTAVDVAKDAADIILVEPGLRVLHAGILEGRRAFGNVMKYLLMGTSSNFGNMASMAAAPLVLPFLPMLPTQILLNNFLYDLSQVTIPSDNVDESYIRKPRQWDMRIVRNFMIFIGPISSIFDILTFFVMLWVFHASEPEFHTGWFVESLATQTLVLFIIRTTGNPLRSPPSKWLALTTILIVLIGLALPFTPIAPLMGFVPLPPGYFVFLVAATAVYLLLVDLVKRRLMRHLTTNDDEQQRREQS